MRADLLLEVAQVPMRDRADSPPSQAVRKTRRQLAKTAHDTKEASVIEEPAVVQENAKELPRHEDNVEEPTKETEQAEEAAAEGGAEEHDVLETVTASVDEDKTRNPDAALEKLQQAAAEEQKTLLPVESLVKTASEELPPPAQDRSRQPSLRPEDSIEALDALEDAIEEVGRVISNVESSSSPEHEKKDSKNTKISPTPKTATSSKRSSVVGGPATHKKVLSTSRPPSIQPKPLKRASSVRPVTTAGPTHSPKATQERPNYLNSKKRPISVSFPTPPPPPKAVKPPTKSNFQLPGEAVAAKLKAQREERIKREAEEKKNKSEARAKRISTSLANAPVVRQTAASKARMSLMQGEGQGQENKRASVLGPKPSAAKRTTTTAPTDAATKRTSSITITNRNRNVPTAAATTAAKRNIPATNVADPGAIASSSAISTEAKANVAKPRLPSGREIFQREKQDRLEREKQQREKEEAAKKARLQAAERGRLASREWAEKMKAKKAGEKSEAREVEKNENAAVAA